MTGKTHMAISTATVAVAMSAIGVRASGGAEYPSHLDPIERGSGLYAIIGLLCLGMLAGLFPDLDAPDTELQRLPRRTAEHLGRYITGGMGGYSPLARLVMELERLVALPFTLVLAAISVALRATTRHRGFTHTLLGVVVFASLVAGTAFLTTQSTQWTLAVGVVWLLGYASHLVADACTPSGIPLLRVPGYATSNGSTRKGTHTQVAPMFHLLPRGMRIETGTIADTIFIRWTAWAICTIAVALMLKA